LQRFTRDDALIFTATVMPGSVARLKSVFPPQDACLTRPEFADSGYGLGRPVPETEYSSWCEIQELCTMKT
jgi:hypothetical protein